MWGPWSCKRFVLIQYTIPNQRCNTSLEKQIVSRNSFKWGFKLHLRRYFDHQPSLFYVSSLGRIGTPVQIGNFTHAVELLHRYVQGSSWSLSIPMFSCQLKIFQVSEYTHIISCNKQAYTEGSLVVPLGANLHLVADHGDETANGHRTSWE